MTDITTATSTLTASDGHSFGIFTATPANPKGALVVVQEIFGLNSHIRDVATRFAQNGYATIAPALFDRAKPGVELDYTGESVKKGIELAHATGGWVNNLMDIQACVAKIKPHGKVGVVGFCWGGSLAWLSACRLSGIDAAVGYYGGQIHGFKDEHPKVPSLLHFAGLDQHISQTDVKDIQAAHPEVPVYIYPDADHGFNCDQRRSYHAESAKLAMERTLAHFAKYLA
ncbi:MAG: dienelactone hydrolase family protein [Proteobacteria bacterium]|nr:dienelactone hydrolase family protein [Pseudomonadota bacterium]